LAAQGVTTLLTAQLPLIEAAAGALDPKPVRTYTRLRQLLGTEGAQARVAFETEFTRYYGLNSGGVTPQFRTVYFDRLYALRGEAINDSCYAPLLQELYEIPRHKGDKALPCSFVSKLIAIHDESRPLFDKYVSRFFGLAAPQSASLDLRIAGFVSNLTTMQANYHAWIEDTRFRVVLEKVRGRIPPLRRCHLVRVCDFLVWQTGKQGRQAAPGKIVNL
jgi:hypothetical protein